MNAEAANDTRDKVRDLRRALYRAAKASPERRFHALYDKVYREDILEVAWQEVRTNGGAAGVDGQSIGDIERSGVEGYLRELASELREERYRPRAVRRVQIPKADGRQRPLGIPAVRDRVVQAAARVVLEPIFEADFRDSSYGFRPKRDAHQALERVRQGVNRGAGWIGEADIEAFFERIDHGKLMELMAKRVSDRRMLRLVKGWLRAGVLEGGERTPTERGVPQGGVISPLLANVVLHELDRLWEDHCGQLGQLIRYADDFVLVCGSEAAAREGLRRARLVLERLGLRLHSEKTCVVEVGSGREGFDFLGYHCRKVEPWRGRGRRYLHQWPSRRAVRGRIKAITAPRHCLAAPLEGIVDEVNQVVRGWGAYFRVGNTSRQLRQVDDYVRGRLGRLLNKKTGRSGPGWQRHTLACFQALGVHQLSGSVAWTTATPRAVR